MAGSLIGALRVTLGLDSAAFTRGSKQAQAELTGFQKHMKGVTSSAVGLGKAFAGAFAVAGISSLASDAFQMASALTEAASATGVTVEQLQRLRLAAAQNGGSADQMDASLSKLSATLGAAQNGSKQAVTAFEAIGLSVEKLKGLNAGEAFALIADKISKIKDPTLQAAAAKQIFGKSYADLMPLLKGGTAALDEATAASKRNGEISGEDAKKLDELADSWDMMKTRLGVGVANIIASTARAAEGFDNFFKPVNQWAKDFDASVARMASNAAANIGKMVSSIRDWIAGALSRVWEGALSKIEAVKKKFYDLYDSVVGHSYVPDMVDGIVEHFARLQPGMVAVTDAATTDVSDSFSTLEDETVDKTEIIAMSFEEMARSISGALGGLVQSIKRGDFFGIIDGVLGLLGSIGQATGGFNLGPLRFPGAGETVPGLASGGSMRIGGLGGIDRNMLSLNGRPIARVSRGENLHVVPQGTGDGARGLRVQVIENERYWLKVQETTGQIVAAAAAPIANLGSSMAQRNLAQRGSRRLA